MSAVRARPGVRRRAKPSLAARLRVMWVVLALVAVAAAAGLYALARSPWFRVADVAVDLPARSPVAERDVRAAAAIAPDANLWLLPVNAMRTRIEAIPQVDTAHVTRTQFPQPAVTIRVTTRTPAACLRAGNRLVTIDATTRVLHAGCADAALARLDVARGAFARPGATSPDPDTARLVADAMTLADARVPVVALGRDRWGGLVATTADRVRLLFGEDETLAKRAALVAPIRASVAPRPVEAIDLRAPSAPVVRFARKP